MDTEIFFKYWYPLLAAIPSAILSVVFGYGIAVCIQNRQHRWEDEKQKQKSDAEEISRRPNPIELDILRHCLEHVPENGQYHFSGSTSAPFINKRPVKDYVSIAVRENLLSLRDKKYIDIFMDNDVGLSFTMQIDLQRLAQVVRKTEDKH